MEEFVRTWRKTSHHVFRGNTLDRMRRRRWILVTFGDGMTCHCVHCGAKITEATLHIDRIVPGGKYVHGNIQPSCATCNLRRGNDNEWRP